MDVAYGPLGDMGPSATGTSAASAPSPAPVPSPRELAESHFRCWAGRDLTGLAAFLANDATFDDPLASILWRGACLEGLSGLARATTRVEGEHDWPTSTTS